MLNEHGSFAFSLDARCFVNIASCFGTACAAYGCIEGEIARSPMIRNHGKVRQSSLSRRSPRQFR
jgi:hypothetical protein